MKRELPEIIERKRMKIDCTEEESVEIKKHIKIEFFIATDNVEKKKTPEFVEIIQLFPLEYNEVLGELEDEVDEPIKEINGNWENFPRNDYKMLVENLTDNVTLDIRTPYNWAISMMNRYNMPGEIVAEVGRLYFGYGVFNKEYIAKNFPWGKIVKFYELKKYLILEYEDGQTKSTYFKPYVNGHDTHHSYDDIESALAGAISFYFEGSNSRAGEYFIAGLKHIGKK